MRGETTIQLFNAETGDLVYETRDKNMVTNAVSKMLSLRNEWLYGVSTNILGNMTNVFPLHLRAFGGILLFDNAIEESANRILPPGTVKNLGYAGGEYGGSNPRRGTYNANESGPITNGYRHVWDFGTSKANGTIRSVCLSSMSGGNSGWGSYVGLEDNVWAIGFPTSVFTSNQVTKVFELPGKALLMKQTPETGELEFVTFQNNSFRLAKQANFSDLKVMSVLNTDYSRGFTSSLLATIPTQPHTNTYPQERMYYMNGKFHHVYSGTNSTSSTKIVHDIYSIDGLRESTKEITTTATFYGSGQAPMFYYKGLYFASTTPAGSSLSVFTADGTLSSVIDTTNAMVSSSRNLSVYSASYNEQMDKMVLTNVFDSQNNSFVYMIGEDLQLDFVRINKQSSAMMPVASEENLSPYQLLSTISSGEGNSSIYLGMWTPYLATINNLESAVTKTNTQTMKIVYSIYND